MHLISTAIRLSIHRLPADADPPTPPAKSEFWSATRTRDEWSVVQSADEPAPLGAETSGPWRMLQVKGPLPHDAIGILASLAGTLAEADVPLFALSTFDTDYLLVPEALMAQAVAALRGAGHMVGADGQTQ